MHWKLLRAGGLAGPVIEGSDASWHCQLQTSCPGRKEPSPRASNCQTTSVMGQTGPLRRPRNVTTLGATCLSPHKTLMGAPSPSPRVRSPAPSPGSPPAGPGCPHPHPDTSFRQARSLHVSKTLSLSLAPITLHL